MSTTHLAKRGIVLLAVAAVIAGSSAVWAKEGGGDPGAPVSRGVKLDPANRPDTYSTLPSDKRAVLDRENELRNQALRHPLSEGPSSSASTDGRVTPRSGEPVPPDRRAGSGTVYERGCGMLYPGARVEFTNQWAEVQADKMVEVCAGGVTATGAGGVQVTYRIPGGSVMLAPSAQPSPRWLPIPRGGGSVRITGAVGEVLTLQAKDGTLFYFDAGALKYVDGPPVEKVTPVPGAAAP